MTTTITSSTSTTAFADGTTDVATRRPVWRVGIVSGLIAAAATSLVVAVARAADVAVAVQGERIPLLGFAQVTLVGALVGIGIAKLTVRRAARPQRMFVRVTLVLTALSIVPDVIVDAAVATKFVLGLTHVVAAAIIIPALAARIAE